MHTILFHDAFAAEFDALSKPVRRELLAVARAVAMRGPTYGRPKVDTLKGSKHANMKEMRFDADSGVWRVAFAFDPQRNVFVLVAGDKAGVSEKRFYRSLIATADQRYDEHLSSLKKGA